jgi:mono/diheme cytochrome c family protein
VEPTINQADSAAAIRPQFNETPGAVRPDTLDPKSRAKAIKRPEPKRVVEEAESPEQTVTGLRPTTFPAIPLPEPLQVESAGDSRAVVDRVCTACHGLRGMEKYSYSSPDAYKDLVSDMVSRGAVISDEEMATIVDYLYKTYGRK